ncbi:sialic acid-specific 9-O-acetylesterase [Rhodopirellula maiorica SM1]|uniref:Sialic acid-specific 9-O-acetylesterase n=2 Tax=Novipirellula TaxID=2795426 RepID=M5RQQ8_9BACT|nr:sialic acid-specific 9-O-acetylesterase [Rhodopirellula maiorica SM1]
MVLQCEKPVSVWGWANEGDEVSVTFADQKVTTSTVKDGAWSVTLKPMQSSMESRPLRIASGDQTIVIHDVMVGEIWHASGQSNMAMTVRSMSQHLDVVKTDIAAAELPMLRFCRINEAESPEPRSDLRKQAAWTVCSPETVSGFSGVAFYFAKRLQSELGIPIGIIDSSRGGTPIEPFIPRAAFGTHPTLKQELELGDRGDLEGIWKLPGGVRARDANWLPGRLFHARIAPLRRFAVRGAIWYQGESNCGVQEDPRHYQYKMRALVQGWRHALQNDALPVYFVQLPGSGAGEGWPYLREQQRLANDMPNTGMVVTVDIDGEGIHPPNKIDVGHRLALWALAKDFGKSVAFSGPMFDRQVIEGTNVILRFRHADHGLMVADKHGLSVPHETPEEELGHFELTDGVNGWQPATAKIQGNRVVVSNPDVLSPIAVRYAYSVTPENCNLYSRDGLPASPFCSRPDLLSYDPKLPE